jgi:hypothetical protein
MVYLARAIWHSNINDELAPVSRKILFITSGSAEFARKTSFFIPGIFRKLKQIMSGLQKF